MKDEKVIHSNFFIHLFCNINLICILNGMVVSEDVAVDLLCAETKGKEAMTEFINTRLSKRPEVDFFTPIKKIG